MINIKGYYKLIIILQIIILISIRLIYIILGGPKYILSSLTNDDSYYYINTAWNTKIYGFVTFDSFHKTNGVHFLWFFIVYALSYLTNSKIVYLNIILFSNLIIMGFSFIPVYKFGKKIKNEYFGLILSTVWFIQLILYDIFFMGMENTIHNIIIWYIIFYLVKVLEKNDKNKKKSFLILTLLLVINIWVRYDSIIASSIIYIIIIIYLSLYKKRLSFKIILMSAFLAISGLLILFITFYWMGDTFIPISAKIKLNSAQNTTFNNYLTNIFIIITPKIFFTDLGVGGLTLSRIFTIIFVVINLKFLVDIIKKKEKDNKIKIILLIISFSNLIYTILIGNLYNPYFIWYLSLSIIIWVILLSYILNLFIIKLTEKIRNFKKIKVSSYFEYNQVIIFLVIIGVFVSLPFSVFLNIISDYYSEIRTSEFHFFRYNTALWLKNNTNPNIIVGSWNAGEIAFFSDRKVINLDGLVNDNNYFNTILSNNDKFNSTEFIEYLNKMNITYLVDYKFYGFDPIQANFTLIKEFYYIVNSVQKNIQIWSR